MPPGHTYHTPVADSGFPDVRGLDSYAGHKIHAARWDHGYDFAGKRIGIVGTSAGTIEIVPELVRRAEFVKLFQRSPHWVLPQALSRMRVTPAHNRLLAALATRLGMAHLRVKVKDRWLRRQLTPNPVEGRKSILASSDYYPAVQRGNCKLIDWPIATLSPAGVRTSDGVEHRLDAIVFAGGDATGRE